MPDRVFAHIPCANTAYCQLFPLYCHSGHSSLQNCCRSGKARLTDDSEAIQRVRRGTRRDRVLAGLQATNMSGLLSSFLQMLKP